MGSMEKTKHGSCKTLIPTAVLVFVLVLLLLLVLAVFKYLQKRRKRLEIIQKSEQKNYEIASDKYLLQKREKKD